MSKTSPEELKAAISSGIPHTIRGVIWQILACSKNDDLELVSVGLEEGAEVRGLALCAHGAPYGEAGLQEQLDDPYGDVAVRAGDEDLSCWGRWHVFNCELGMCAVLERGGWML